jgi:2,4-dienoyl-CoA reductase-like NADH-dependent reductase (Old Yellow Enzyme family)
MSVLFDPIEIRGMALRNRFVRSATYDGCAEKNGHVSQKQLRMYEELDGGAKIAVQLFHAGRETAKTFRPQRKQAIAPSLVSDDPYFQEPHRAITEDEIREIIRAFGDASRRAREAGLDAVQLHAAHAYLLSQFLSPFTNRRADQWGGNLENRLRLHHEIYRDIRAKVGGDYPVLVKIGVEDSFAGGLEFDEGKRAARYLSEWGFDALEISSGLRGIGYGNAEFRPGINQLEREGYFREWCREIRRNVHFLQQML